MSDVSKLSGDEFNEMIESGDWPKVDPDTGEEWWPEDLFEPLAPGGAMPEDVQPEEPREDAEHRLGRLRALVEAAEEGDDAAY